MVDLTLKNINTFNPSDKHLFKNLV